MTIYKPKTGDRKPPKGVKSTSAEVVIEGVPLSNGKKIDELSARLIVVSAARRRRNNMFAVIALVLVLCVAAISVGAGLFIYKHMNRPYMDMCDVQYHEGSTSGQFQESVEIDRINGFYEKLHVPPVLDSRRSTIVHDFEKNLTAIVDNDRARCFVMDLNRTTVQPPQSFMDLVIKTRSGYYIPNAEVIRSRYRVVEPRVEDVIPFGEYIYYECQYFDTYRLIRMDEPYAMSRKRSVDGQQLHGIFNLGETMGKYLEIVEIVE